MRIMTTGRARQELWANGEGRSDVLFESDGGIRLLRTLVERPSPLPPSAGARVLINTDRRPLSVSFDGSDRSVARFELVEIRAAQSVHLRADEGPVAVVIIESAVGADLDHYAAGAALSIRSGLAEMLLVLDGALSVETPGEAFPFNPTTERVSRLDLLLLDGPSLSTVRSIGESTVVRVAVAASRQALR